jgi:hypothetical protein
MGESAMRTKESPALEVNTHSYTRINCFGRALHTPRGVEWGMLVPALRLDLGNDG